MREFFIGYLPKMPPGIARPVRLFAGVAIGLALFLALAFIVGQAPFAASYFDFGVVTDFEGTIQAKPVPFLLVEKPAASSGLPVFERFPLVGEFKHGAGPDVTGLDGRRVRLKGTKIYRDGLQMIEVAGGSVAETGGPATAIDSPAESLGRQTLRGEIVDSKCYLGVMNPGASKTHRQCAVACLRGGIPALFIVKDAQGNTSELWLLSEIGDSMNKDVLDFVAEPVAITGEVKRTGDQLFFYADPSTIRRLE